MKNIYIILLLIVAFISCSREKLPDGILGKNKMVAILIDIHLSEAITSQRYALGLTRDSLPEDIYLSICQKHNVDYKTLENSLHYYGRNPEKYTKIYDVVLDRLSEMEIEAKKDTIPDVAPSWGGDTIKTQPQDIPGDSVKTATRADSITRELKKRELKDTE